MQRTSSAIQIRNIRQRERAQKELEELYEIRKQEEINEVNLKNLNSELNQEIVEAKAKLDATIIQLLKARSDIKKLNQKIAALERENLSLQVDTFQSERSKIDQILSIKETLQAETISTEIRRYLETDIPGRKNPLHDFCLECYKDDAYANFFHRLEQKLYGKVSLPRLRYGSRSIDRTKEQEILKTPVRSHRRVKTLAA